MVCSDGILEGARPRLFLMSMIAVFAACSDDATGSDCEDRCPAADEVSCAAGELSTCVMGSDGCLAWGAPSLCDPGTDCGDGECNSADPSACRVDCTLPFCGDGIEDNDEGCGEGENNGSTPDSCRIDCSLPTCGDGILDGGEACDEGELTCQGGVLEGSRCTDDDDCADGVCTCQDIDEICNDSIPDRCRKSCVMPSCGDGAVDSGEECDDDNNSSGDGCTADCVIE